MATVPLGMGAHRRSDAFVPEVVCLNMVLEADKSGLSPDKTLRIQRPGLVTQAFLPAPIRGMIYASKTDKRMTVAGSTLYINEVAAGSVFGDGPAPMVGTAFGVAIVGGNTAYYYTNEGDFSTVPMPDARIVTDVEQLNGYILFASTGGRFYWMEPGETTVEALNYATAESLPDGLIAICRVGDDLLMLGSESGEWWQSTGDADAPFQRVSGRTYERGCLARDTVRRFDNTVVWVGDDGNVYRGGAVPTVISDEGISERIRKATGPLSAWVFGVDGHKFYALRIPGQGTLCYDASTNEWPEFRSEGQDVWLPYVGYEEAGFVYAGSSEDGKIWRVDGSVTTDEGSPFTRTVTGTVPVLGKPPRNDSLTLGVGASADCTVLLRWKDGQDDYPPYPDELAVRAPLDLATMWRLGQPDQPYRTFEVSCVDPVRVQFNGLVVNEAWA